MKTLRLFLLLFALLAVPLTASAQSAKRYYVAIDPTTPDFNKWPAGTPVCTLEQALAQAQAGDEIWVLGYIREGNAKYRYVAPKNGFLLRSGVKLYGGFKGTEKTTAERKTVDGRVHQLLYRSILTGDRKHDDVVDPSLYIFPKGKNNRADNSYHVITVNMDPKKTIETDGYQGNMNNTRTEINGFVITRGNAVGAAENDKLGGGVLVMNDNTGGGMMEGGVIEIRRCYFTENYAETAGGALHLGAQVKNGLNEVNDVNRCAFFNNAAGEREESYNHGGAICIGGDGYVSNSVIFNNENGGILASSRTSQNRDRTVINCTVTRNTGSGIDCNLAAGNAKLNVFNTVIWGNMRVTSDLQKTLPNLYYCAVTGDLSKLPNAQTNHNIAIADKNNEQNGPAFAMASKKRGYDIEFDIRKEDYPHWSWIPLEGTSLVDKGNTTYYEKFDPQAKLHPHDLEGDPRVAGQSIDIGAYEFQPIAAGRIRYVREGATGDGRSWATASGDLQAMIDELANINPNNEEGEVWVTAGTYIPQYTLTDNSYTAAFRMRDGISVYGGFSKTNPETCKQDRPKGITPGATEVYPWEVPESNITYLCGRDFAPKSGADYSQNYQKNLHKWSFTSNSFHVVWFGPATYQGEFTPFARPTYLDGVTIKGGYAQGLGSSSSTPQAGPQTAATPQPAAYGSGSANETITFMADRGAGVYMNTANAYLRNCVVKENNAKQNGGGVYVKDGRVFSCLIYNNNADRNGGGIYVEDAGIVLRSVISNNTAERGGGVYLHNTDYRPNEPLDQSRPTYLMLSTSVVANNTSQMNGAVFCDQGGILLQNTIVNNHCPTATDQVNPNAAQTGGVYLDGYGTLINSVIWNNRNGAIDPLKCVDIPGYAKNPTTDKVRFLYNAMSGTSNAIWNNTLSVEMLQLTSLNKTVKGRAMVGPDFATGTQMMTTDKELQEKIGVQPEWNWITYYWRPKTGSNLWGNGLPGAQLPEFVPMQPELDCTSKELFLQKPAIGAFQVKAQEIVHDATTKEYILYVDPNNTDITADGSSWNSPYRSLNHALSYFANLDGIPFTVEKLVIKVHAGEIVPQYAFSSESAKSATLRIQPNKSGKPIRIEGGWVAKQGTTGMIGERDLQAHRTTINANPSGLSLEGGNYHALTVTGGAMVELDGLHITGGYAAGSADVQQGGGVFVAKDAEVTMSNCIVENNTAVVHAAIAAKEAKSLKLINCVINNNTNLAVTENDPNLPPANLPPANHMPLIIGEPMSATTAPATTYTHVTVVNNYGIAPDFTALPNNTSFAAGNLKWNNTALTPDLANNSFNLETVGKKGGEKNFANPTNHVGATLGYLTYYGGYSNFRPLTSSTEVGDAIINQVATRIDGLNEDITQDNPRDLGGIPDLGAYEALLERKGTVYYVRTNGNDANDGQSWKYAFATVRKAVEKAAGATLIKGAKPQVWVAAGTYSQDPKSGSDNCFEIKEGVNVFGAFPKKGNPGMKDRHPFISDFIYHDDTLQAENYETILTPKTQTGWNAPPRRRVLGQENIYNPEKGDYGQNFTESTTWDGFTLYKGFMDTKDISNQTNNGSPSNRNGGAGAAIFYNVTLKNCIVTECNTISTNCTGYGRQTDIRAGGVYCDKGTLINCYVVKNTLGTKEQVAPYGAGVYLYEGTMYNCVINQNESWGECADGAGIFIENGVFFNNTVVYNHSHGTLRGSGGIQVYKSQTSAALTLYNCISLFNSGKTGNVSGNQDIIVGNTGGKIKCFNTIAGDNKPVTNGDVFIEYNNCKATTTNIFQTYTTPDGTTHNYRSPKPNLRLLPGCIALNMGDDNPKPDNTTTIHLSDYTDMDFTNRIKDCRVDAGAYELENHQNVDYTLTKGKTAEVPDTATFYVTWTGQGKSNAKDPQNAACAMKLQEVLNHAGDVALRLNNGDGTATNPGRPTAVIVKVAGYQRVREMTPFKYHANTLSDPNDPKSYTFTIPYGITLMGGYMEGRMVNGKPAGSNWEILDRDITNYRTVLSAIEKGTTEMDVRGYHTLTFSPKPAGWTKNDRPTIVDGVYLTDGLATINASLNDERTRGGGAIVKPWAHIRNCVVTNNNARYGGGLYVEHGGTVSGTLIINNKALNRGGGIYADNGNDPTQPEGNAAHRSHFISNTIVKNDAVNGGGIFLEDGAAMSANLVVWGNQAAADNNISGATSILLADAVFQQVQGVDARWHPFNFCFVEGVALATNFHNEPMKSEKNFYFNHDTQGLNFTLKRYSQLINNGMNQTGQKRLEQLLQIAPYDMRGRSRIDRLYQNESAATHYIDAGAFAREATRLPTNHLVTRLFVSQSSEHIISANQSTREHIKGKTFYTAFPWLEDAFEYINIMRSLPKPTNPKMLDLGDLARKSTFEILVANGEYIPKNPRKDAASPLYNQRHNSFAVPYNVHLYGGFKGDEMYSSDGVTAVTFEELNAEGKYVDVIKTFTPDVTIDSLLKKRTHSDFNQNNLYEPWELAGQSILSGRLNPATKEKNAYHVVYAKRDPKAPKDVKQGILLDGFIVKEGRTVTDSLPKKDNEVGRGGGVYCDGLSLTMANCRVVENEGIRGAGIFVRDASLYLFSSIIAGNHAVDAKNGRDKAFGGGAFVTQTELNPDTLAIAAAHTLWTNNTADSYGGALATGNVIRKGMAHDSIIANRNIGIHMLNSTVARNKAYQHAVAYNSQGSTYLTNVLMWGNEAHAETGKQPELRLSLTCCANDEDYFLRFSLNNNPVFPNVMLDKANLSAKGPRFARPSKVAGIEGYSFEDRWDPLAISPTTDTGSGLYQLNPQKEQKHEIHSYGAWWDGLEYVVKSYDLKEKLRIYRAQHYYNRYQLDEANWVDPTIPPRYSSPLGKDGKPQDRTIDIGYYEYQFNTGFSTMPAIYVDITGHGLRDGSSWENATDDLRGAIMGAANPTQENGNRTVYVKHGNYATPMILDDGTAIPLYTSFRAGVSGDILTIKGSCTGVNHEQDFRIPTVLTQHPMALKPSKLISTKQLLTIDVNQGTYKQVNIEGIDFRNQTNDSIQRVKPDPPIAILGSGVSIGTLADRTTTTFRNCAMRHNTEHGLIKKATDSGKLLLVNTLIADNGTNGLHFDQGGTPGPVTLVNTTFANNGGADMSQGVTNTFNSTSWNNTTTNMAETQDHNNEVWSKAVIEANGQAAEDHNSDLLNGPNFVDPLNPNKDLRNYRIRPSMTLLNKGAVNLYAQHAMGLTNPTWTKIPDTEKDLYNVNRQVDHSIDIGAYEYEALLNPVLYVKSNVVGGNSDGTSWENATGDLQGAADMAGIYHHNNTNRKAYVFVHHNVKLNEPLNVTLPGVSIYGGMKDETSDHTTQDEATTTQLVNELLTKREGLLNERNYEHGHLSRSVLSSGLNLIANSVVDGFEIKGQDPTIANGGVLSTSIVGSPTAQLNVTSYQSPTSEGTLYNSLLFGSATGVRAVNVTATGTLNPTAASTTTAPATSGNNRASVTEKNRYVTKMGWDYQLNETDKANLHTGDNALTQPMIKQVGHGRDLAGNLRLRGTAVDNGCFETWDLPQGGKITPEDYPRDSSVVYVREDQELVIAPKVYDETHPFNPAFTLFEYHAGIRGNGNFIDLKRLAAERRLNAQGEDLACLPFVITEVPQDVTLQMYDGNTRAGFSYKFNENGGAWKENKRENLSTGLLVKGKGKANATIRFYGKTYTEMVQRSTLKQKLIELQKFNFSDPWSTPSAPGSKFTHKENMSWNLFGSPYLCRMRYDDLPYGRIVYHLGDDSNYKTLSMYNEADGTMVKGYFPAGDAVFTQTATLKRSEVITPTAPTEKNVPTTPDYAPYATANLLQVKLTRHGATADEAPALTTASATEETTDTLNTEPLQLRPVEAEMARADFDLSGDGVKWMGHDQAPQLYAVQNGGRYSLLGAVNREGTVEVGVRLPAAGIYTFSVPAEVDTTGYEVVLLEDRVNRRTTDLLEADYAFTTTVAGEVNDRFTLRFIGKHSALTRKLRARRTAPNTFRIEGIEPGDFIRIFTADGKTAATQTASAPTETVEAFVPTTAIVEVKRNGRPVGVVKVR